jgi:hypothetical protein
MFGIPSPRSIKLDNKFLGRKKTNNKSPLDSVIRQIAVILCSNDTQKLEWWKLGHPHATEPEHVNEMSFDTFQIDILMEKEEANLDLPCTPYTENPYPDPCTLHRAEIRACLQVYGIIDNKSYVNIQYMGSKKIEELKRCESSRHATLIDYYQNQRPDCSQLYLATYKVSSADMDPRKLHHLLKSADDKEENYLKRKYMTIYDVDFKQDFACCVTPNVLKHLEEELKLRTITKGKYKKGEEKELVILKNFRDVGMNCITLIGMVNDVWVRAKLYNKFVHMMESVSVRGWIGSHIHHWVHENGKAGELLGQAIRDRKTQESGLSRIEFTLEEIPQDFDQLVAIMQRLKEIFLPGTNATSIENQWGVLASCCKETSYIYDCHTGGLHSIRWINKLTRKANGFKVDTSLHKKTRIYDLIRAGSFYGKDIKLWLLDYEVFAADKKKKEYHGFDFDAMGNEAKKTEETKEETPSRPMSRKRKIREEEEEEDDDDDESESESETETESENKDETPNNFRLSIATYQRTGPCDQVATIVAGKVQYQFFYDDRPLVAGLCDFPHLKLNLDKKQGEIERWDTRLIPSPIGDQPLQQLQIVQDTKVGCKEFEYKKHHSKATSGGGALPLLSSIEVSSSNDLDPEEIQVRAFKSFKLPKLEDMKVLDRAEYKIIYLSPADKLYRGNQIYIMLLSGEKKAFRVRRNVKISQDMIDRQGRDCYLIRGKQLKGKRGKVEWKYTVEIR